MKLTKTYIIKYLKDFKDVTLSYPFGENICVFSFKDQMFALLEKDKVPLRLSLKCDPLLAHVLRERYEEVLPGFNLNKKNWNTILLTGQLSEEKLKDLIRHSYELAQSISLGA